MCPRTHTRCHCRCFLALLFTHTFVHTHSRRTHTLSSHTHTLVAHTHSCRTHTLLFTHTFVHTRTQFHFIFPTHVRWLPELIWTSLDQKSPVVKEVFSSPAASILRHKKIHGKFLAEKDPSLARNLLGSGFEVF